MMTRHGFYPAMSLALVALSAQVSAELFVIKDYGNTRASGIPDLTASTANSLQPPDKMPVFDPYPFPIESESWQLGNLAQPYEHGRKIGGSFVIVGADAQSQAWLQRNGEYFQQEAITQGVIVEAETRDDLVATVQLAQRLGIALTLTGIDDMSGLLGTRIYPILVTPKEVKQ